MRGSEQTAQAHLNAIKSETSTIEKLKKRHERFRDNFRQLRKEFEDIAPKYPLRKSLDSIMNSCYEARSRSETHGSSLQEAQDCLEEAGSVVKRKQAEVEALKEKISAADKEISEMKHKKRRTTLIQNWFNEFGTVGIEGLKLDEVDSLASILKIPGEDRQQTEQNADEQ